jgi:hypothetical protein
MSRYYHDAATSDKSAIIVERLEMMVLEVGGPNPL